jgi:hypothetical protein
MNKLLLYITLTLIINATTNVPVLFASTDNVSASAKLDTNRITIGDQVNYTVTLANPPDYTLSAPAKPAQIGQWDVKDLKVSQENKDKLYSYINYTLTTFTTGQVIIPEMTFQLTDNNNSQFNVAIQSVTVTVDSVLGLVKGTPGLRDIKPPLYLVIPLGVYLFWLLIAAVALTGAWLWYQNYRKRLPQLPAGPIVPPVPPFQAAKEELEKLRNSNLIKEGMIKEFYIALTDIIRKYLGAVYSIDTMDKTTAEIYQQLRAQEQDKKALILIRDFFEECDFVKFAKYRPEEKIIWDDFEKAEQIIEN